MYELLIFVVLSLTLECGMGIVYGIAIGYNPALVFPTAIILNFAAIFLAIFLVERLFGEKA